MSIDRKVEGGKKSRAELECARILMEATPTCTSLFSTIAGDISVDTVNSVISDLNLFRKSF